MLVWVRKGEGVGVGGSKYCLTLDSQGHCTGISLVSVSSIVLFLHSFFFVEHFICLFVLVPSVASFTHCISWQVCMARSLLTVTR